MTQGTTRRKVGAAAGCQTQQFHGYCRVFHAQLGKEVMQDKFKKFQTLSFLECEAPTRNFLMRFPHAFRSIQGLGIGVERLFRCALFVVFSLCMQH